VVLFLLVDPFVPKDSFLGFSFKAGYWAFCGAWIGIIFQEGFSSLRALEFGEVADAKRFNEQIKLTATLLNSFAIGFLGVAVFQKISGAQSLFRYDSILWVLAAIYFHYLGLKILDLWKPEK
jgi:hypothetical protein